jgi:uncharacterized membrane protein YqaE (UPF0057 family)
MEVCLSIFVILFILGFALLAQDRGNEKLLCTNCGYLGIVSKKAQGSCLIELALWLCFILPGLIYSVWRLSSKIYTCPDCESKNLIPENSPVAQRFISENYN